MDEVEIIFLSLFFLIVGYFRTKTNSEHHTSKYISRTITLALCTKFIHSHTTQQVIFTVCPLCITVVDRQAQSLYDRISCGHNLYNAL